jgi:hypothetical protein
VPTISFERFDAGMDLRKGPSASDANRLRDLKNAYVTTGWQIAKRPGLTLIATLEPGTVGLVAAQGKLHTFSNATLVTHANALFENHIVAYESGAAALVDVPQALTFSGYLYVVAKYDNGQYRHHYLDGTSPTRVTDTNCPHSASITKAASKVFAVNGDVVAFSATNAPRDWTTSNDAGYLPTGVQVGGTPDAMAIGTYRSRLAVFSVDTSQTWDVDPDPAMMKLNQVLENLGTRHPLSVVNVGNDIYFLADIGYRSITTQEQTGSLADVDIGSPIDSLVRQDIAAAGAGINPIGIYFKGAGQYWCAIGRRVHVFTYSRTAKIAAWSYYEFPQAIEALAELDGVMYLRSANDVYQVDDQAASDAGAVVEVVVQLPYLSFKTPGTLKQVWGMDAVMDGGCDVSLLFDARDQTAETFPVPFSGDTRPGEITPIEACGTELSMRFRNVTTEPWRLDAIVVHYETLGIL